MTYHTIIPRRGRYLIQAADDQGQRCFVERYDSERQAIHRLRELKAHEESLYIDLVRDDDSENRLPR